MPSKVPGYRKYHFHNQKPNIIVCIITEIICLLETSYFTDGQLIN